MYVTAEWTPSVHLIGSPPGLPERHGKGTLQMEGTIHEPSWKHTKAWCVSGTMKSSVQIFDYWDGPRGSLSLARMQDPNELTDKAWNQKVSVFQANT